MSATLRVFIAIEFEAPVRAALVRRMHAWRAVLPDLRWVAPEALHLTLAFLGEVEQAGLRLATEATAEAAGAGQPFRLALGRPGTFGRPEAPRVLWLGLEGDHRALMACQRRLAQALEARGLSGTGQPFAPHVTLARFAAAPTVEAQARLAALLATPPQPGPAAEQQVEALSVMQSELLRPRARYTALARLPLGGADAGTEPHG